MSNSELREVLGLLTSTTNLTVKLQAIQTLEQAAQLITSCTDEKLQFQLIEAIGTLIIRPSSEIPETRYHAIKTLLSMTSEEDSTSHIPIVLLSATSKCSTKELISTLIGDTVAPLRIHKCSWKGCTVNGPNKYLVGLQRCSQCKNAYYCCPGCAKLDWSAGHKAVCKGIAAHKAVNPKSAARMDDEIAFVAAALLTNLSRNETACGKLASHLGLMVEAACLLAREEDEKLKKIAGCLADAVMNATQDSLCRKAVVKRSEASEDIGKMPVIKYSNDTAESKKSAKSKSKKSGAQKEKEKPSSVPESEEKKEEEDNVVHSPLYNVIEVLSKSKNEQIRKAAYGSVRNICFENHLQESILKKEGSDVNVMTFLLSNIRGTKELTEDDKEGMNPALYAPRKMEPSLECRKLILDALLLLACYRPSREVLITDMSYPILRDYHTAEEDEEAKDKVSTIVDILARDSTGNGKCPIAKPLPRQDAQPAEKAVEEKSKPKIEVLDENSDEVATVKSGNDYKLQKEKEEEERRRKEKEMKEAEAVAAAVADLEEI